MAVTYKKIEEKYQCIRLGSGYGSSIEIRRGKNWNDEWGPWEINGKLAAMVPPVYTSTDRMKEFQDNLQTAMKIMNGEIDIDSITIQQ